TPLPPQSLPPPTSAPTPPPAPAPTPPPANSGGGGGGSGGGGGTYTSSGQEGYDILTSGVDTSTSPGAAGAEILGGNVVHGTSTRLGGGGSSTQQSGSLDEDKPFIGSTLEPAISKGEQYRLAREERGNIAGTLWYAGQKTSGWLSSSPLSPVKDSGYQAPVGKLASYSTEVGPYFVPVVGPALMVGTGAEAIGTKAGRGRISSTSTDLETNYNIPTWVSTPTQYGLYAGGTVLGGMSLTKSATTALNLPRTQVKLGGVTQTINEGKIVTQANYRADTKTLFGTKTRYGRATTTTDFKPTPEGDFILGKSNTVTTSFNPSKLNLPGGKTRIGDIKGSQSFTGSVTKEDIILEKVTGPKLSGTIAEYEGYSSAFFGKGAYGTPKTLGTKGQTKFKFIGEGGSYEVGEVTNIFGKSSLVKDGKVLKVGTTTYEGVLVKPNIPSDSGVKILSPSGTITKTPLSATFTNEAQKLAAGIRVPTPKTPTIPKVPGVTTTNIKTTTRGTYAPTTTTTTTFADTSTTGVMPSLDTVTTTLDKPKSGGRSTSYLTTAQPPTSGTKQPTIPTITSAAPTRTILKTSTKLGTPSGTSPFTPTTPFIPGMRIPFALGSFGDGVKGMRRIKTSVKFGYTPSYTALAFGIKGKQRAPSIGRKYTGFEFRPITKGYTEMFKSKWRPKKSQRIKLFM
ncbi:MAG: hypothetical protein B6229_00270, partial [Spirochaetaceae bacterium 4572_7]